MSAWLIAVLFSVPLLILPVQAIADEWRAPSVAPQRWGLRGLDAVVTDPLVPRALLNSFLIAGAAVIISLPITWWAARSLSSPTVRGSMRVKIGIAILLPLLLPPLAVGQGLRHAFLSAGLGFSLAGIVLSHLVFVIPYMLVVLLPSFTEELFQREEAAIGLGAGVWWRWRLITLPSVRPNLQVAGALGFVVSWSQYGTTLGVGGGIPTLPLVLLPFLRSDPQVSAVLSLIFVAPAMLAIGLSVRANRR